MQERGWRPRHIDNCPKKAPRSMPESLWQVLFQRGLTTEKDLEQHFSPSLKGLKNPFALHDMDKAVKILLEVFERQQALCIYADFDLDGTPGLALLKSGLEKLGFNKVSYYQPKRLAEGYGVHVNVIEELAQEGIEALITVDVGITDIVAISRAKELGLKVVITDHHLPKEQLPPADAIVNPNKGFCAAQLEHLCGTGVAFYLILALRSELKKYGLLKTDFDPKVLLDCFAIGTITDMVPLIKENRVLVKHGLIQLAKTQRPGLRALLKSLDLWGRPLNSQDVGFRFAPKLNALSRMEEQLLPIDIFLVESDNEAEGLVVEVMNCHNKRVAIQKKAEQEAEELRLQKTWQKGFLWLWSEKFHQGVVGLVATKLAQKYSLPVFIGALKEGGKIVGSSRSGSTQSVLEALEASSPALSKYGGHDMAAGFEVELAQVEELEQLLSAYFKNQQPLKINEDVLYDVEGEVSQLNPEFMNWYEAAGPYGQEFEAPILLLSHLKVLKVRSLRGGHFKISLNTHLQKEPVVAMCFSPEKAQSLVVEGLEPGHEVDILAEPQWNYYMGGRTLQLLLKEIRVSF